MLIWWWFFDLYGSYENMWWLSVALGVIAFLLTITVKEEPFSVNSEINKQVKNLNHLCSYIHLNILDLLKPFDY